MSTKNPISPSKTLKCAKCGVKTYHTLIDVLKHTYRCVKCGNCRPLR